MTNELKQWSEDNLPTDEETETLQDLIDNSDHPIAMQAFYDNQPQYWDKYPEEFEDAFNDSYVGEYESTKDYAEEYAQETVQELNIGLWPFNCIDWEDAWSELETDGSHWAANSKHGSVYIFRSL